jgi:hypothetical protein
LCSEIRSFCSPRALQMPILVWIRVGIKKESRVGCLFIKG